MSAQWHCRALSEHEYHAADTFVGGAPGGGIHQSQAWAQFQSQITGRTLLGAFGAFDAHNELQAVCWVLRFHTGYGTWHWAYSPRGPVGTISAVTALVAWLPAQLRQDKRLMHWRTDGPFSEEEYTQLGFADAWNETRSYHPTDSLIIDLTPDAAEILAQMKRKGRYNIKKSDTNGVSVVRTAGPNVTTEQLDVFMGLQQQTTLRDGFRGHNAVYYKTLLTALGTGAQLFAATTESSDVIAMAILTVWQREAIYYFGVSSSAPEHRNLMAPYGLQWAMMQYAKTAGATHYDLTGIAPEGEPEHSYARMTQFKTRFGGTRRVHAAGREIALRPFLYRLYRLAHWLKS